MSSVFTDYLADEEGRLERPGRWGTIDGVDAAVSGDRLYWLLNPAKQPTPGEGMLRGFLALADAPAARIRSYANRWGALDLCEHDLPWTHNPGPIRPYSGPAYWCSARGWDDSAPWEPLASWHLFASEAAAITRIAIAVRDGKPGTANDWALVYARSGLPAPFRKSKRGNEAVHAARELLARAVTEWLRLGDVRPMVTAPTRDAGVDVEIVYAGRGLFGALAMQLAMAVTATRGFYHCAGCGESFDIAAGARKPQAGRGAYCGSCIAANIPQRRASERARARRTTRVR